jgi:alcohol dehydrogenase class IV
MLLQLAGAASDPQQAADRLATRLHELATAAGLPTSLGVSKDELPALAKETAMEWTGTFKPHPFDAAGALEIYRAAF